MKEGNQGIFQVLALWSVTDFQAQEHRHRASGGWRHQVVYDCQHTPGSLKDIHFSWPRNCSCPT